MKLDMYKDGAEVQARLLYGNELVEADNVPFKEGAAGEDKRDGKARNDRDGHFHCGTFVERDDGVFKAPAGA